MFLPNFRRVFAHVGETFRQNFALGAFAPKELGASNRNHRSHGSHFGDSPPCAPAEARWCFFFNFRWEVRNGVGVDGVGGIFPFLHFFRFSSLFFFVFFNAFLRFSCFFPCFSSIFA